MIRPSIRASVLCAILLFVAAISGAAPARGQAPTAGPDELASALTRPALVYIETFWTGYVSDEEGVYFNDGDPIEFSSSCTGFVVNPQGYIATAGHCVDETASFGGAKQRLIELAAEEAHEERDYEGSPSEEELVAFGLANWTVEGTEKGGPIEREVFAQRGPAIPGEQSDSAMSARVVDFRPADSGDVALIKVDQKDLPTLLVVTGAEPRVGTSLLLAGYPASADRSADDPIEPRTETGSLAAARTEADHRVYEVTAKIGEGMSGGPTVNLQGDVIGINSYRVNETEASGFVVSGQSLLEVLARNQVANEFGAVDELYRQALAAFFGGRMAEARGAFDQVLARDPEHRLAETYRARAAASDETPEPVPPVPRDTSRLLPLGLGLVVLAAIGGTVFTRRAGAWRGPTRGDPPRR